MQRLLVLLAVLVVATSSCRSPDHEFESATVVQVRHEVLRLFPTVWDGGAVACRKQVGALGDPTLWSQHAYGNAWDAAVPDLETGDAVHHYLIANSDRLGVGIILWRQADHFDHLHIEGTEIGVGTPECATSD